MSAPAKKHGDVRCKYQDSPGGCKHGAGCDYRHDVDGKAAPEADSARTEQVREKFALGVKVMKGFVCGACVYCIIMAVAMVWATLAGTIGLSQKVAITFAQVFNVIFLVGIILASLKVDAFCRHLQFLKRWGWLGCFMLYVGWTLYSYTQSTAELHAGAAAASSFVSGSSSSSSSRGAWETAATVAAWILVSCGAVHMVLAAFSLQKLLDPDEAIRSKVVDEDKHVGGGGAVGAADDSARTNKVKDHVVLGVKVAKGLGCLMAGYCLVMALCLIVAALTGANVPLGRRVIVFFEQLFNILFCLGIIFSLLGLEFFVKLANVLRRWAWIGALMLYTGFQLLSYTQTTLAILSQSSTTRSGILATPRTLQTFCEIAAWSLMALGIVFMILGNCGIQALVDGDGQAADEDKAETLLNEERSGDAAAAAGGGAKRI